MAVLLPMPGFAQTVSAMSNDLEISMQTWADVFYVYDFAQPTKPKRQDFLYNHNRHNEFNLNLGILKVAARHNRYRANLAFHSGSYVNDNYANESGTLKNIAEANLGVALNKSGNLWLDAGILPSYTGFESAISSQNFTLTRSLVAENSPYFLSGVNLSYQPNQHWKMGGMVMNGWQRIQRLAGNSLLSFGTQVQYTPYLRTNFVWNTFLGTDDPDSTRRWRLFNNFYFQTKINKRLRIIGGIDLGAQQENKGSSDYHFWYGPIIIGQYQFNSVWRTALRLEYYSDRQGVIINTGTPNGFRTSGVSANVDFVPNPHIYYRLEARLLQSQDNIFSLHSSPSKNNFFIATSMSIDFSTILNQQARSANTIRIAK